jgi:hypothetical protein
LEDDRGTHFYIGDCALVIKRWIHRVEEDASGLTFHEWKPDVDKSRPTVTMMINSSELRAGLEGMTPKSLVLSVDDDT